MLLSTFVSDKYKKVLVNSIILCGAVQALYAVCQCYSWLNVKQVFHPYLYFDERVNAKVYGREVWVLGLTNNPNFFGTYMLLCLSYSIGLLLDSKKIWSGIIYSIFTALFMFCLLAANAASSGVGLIFVLCFILIYCIKNKLFKKLIVLTLILVAVTVFAVNQKKTTLLKDMKIIGFEATELAIGNVDDSYGTNRMFIWKSTVKVIPEHFWHGVGIDSFHKAFDGKALTLKAITTGNITVLYDKAHNEYLQILITEGIFALVSYVLLYGYTIFCGLRRAFKYKEVYLVLPIIGYLVQAFFNISVIEVAPMFYMALGLCATQVGTKSSCATSSK